MEESAEGEESLGWTDERVANVMLLGLEPLRTAMEGMKSTLVDLSNQVGEIRNTLAQQQLQQTSEHQRDDDETQPKTLFSPPEGARRQWSDTERETEDQSRGEGRESVASDGASAPRRSPSRQVAEPDIREELKWFREHVERLHADLTAQKDQNKDILNKVEAHCSYTEAVIKDYEKTRDDVNAMLAEIKNQTQGTVAAPEAPTAAGPVAAPEAAGNAESVEDAVEKLKELAIGLSQRVIDEIRNPTSGSQRQIIHFYVKIFEDCIASGRTVYGQQCPIDFPGHIFMVARGTASFTYDESPMTVGLETTMDARELGLEQGAAMSVTIKARIKGQGEPDTPDIEVGEQIVTWGGDPTQANGSYFITLGEVEDVKQLLDKGYNTFKERSILIEFEISCSPSGESSMYRLIGRVFHR